MASRPAPGTAWALFKFFLQGDMKEFQTDFWYSISSGSVSPGYNYNAACNAVYAALVPDWKTILTPLTTIRGCIGYFNDGTGTLGAEYYQNTIGTLTDTPLPEDVTAIVRKQTANVMRGGQGRFRFGMIGESLTSGSYLVPGGITAMQPFAIAIKTAVTSGGVTFSPAHFSPKLNLLLAMQDTPVVGLLGTARRRRGPF